MLSSKDQAKHCVSGIIQEGSEITKAQAHSDSSVQVLVSDTAQSNVESQHEKVSTGSAVISSAKQQIITNETTKIVSSQQTTSILAVEQHLQTTTKKTVTVSSDQMAQSDQTDKVETAVRCVTGQGKKEIKTQKTKSSIKSEDQRKDETKTNQVLNNVSKDETKNKNLSSNKSQENVSDQQIEKTSTNAKGKVSKQNQKSKKNNNKQEAPVETSNCNESERCSVSKDFKVKQLEAAEIKPEIKEDIPIPALAATPQISNGNQLETQAPTKKKKKSKKSKGAAQQGQSKENVTESNTGTKRLANEMTQRAHETIAIGQIHKGTKVEHVEIKSEAITTGTKEDKKSLQQKAPQIQQKESQKKEVTAIQQSAKEQPKESRNVPITVTGKSEQNELVNLTEERIKGSQRHDVQVLISQITEIQSSSENTVSKSVKRLLNSTPDWIITPEMKQKLEQRAAESDAEKNEEILLNIRKLAESKLMDLADKTFEMRKCEGEKEGSVLVGQNISQISICSSKTEQQTFKSTSSEIRREERSLCKSIDLQAPSPSLRMRPPSPTFITIESMRRIDSPQRVTPSPTLLHRPITPSPTFDKAENLARLKETTAKLSRVVTPPPLLTHQITEKKSEVVEMPTNDVLQKEPNAAEDSDDSDLISASFKEKRDFFEGAQKAELNKISVHKEPITLTERLGPDMVDCEAENKNTEKDESLGSDLSSFVNKTESPEETLYNREELTPPAECLHSDTESSECDKEKAGILQQEMQSTPLHFLKRNTETILAQPSALAETKTITEHFSDVDEFGNKLTGTVTAITQHSESISTSQVPFSYADAVKKKAARRAETYDEDATEKLLRNFHKTWTESETVFKNLGYTVCEESSSKAVLHQTTTVSLGKDRMPRKTLHDMLEEGLSDGCSDGGQKKVP
uniref:Xin actin binding repeat containing 2b n=1 Tax=Cyprinodon variegatus TaxID=28743 RepID=A0A3Q2C934_CYPVA